MTSTVVVFFSWAATARGALAGLPAWDAATAAITVVMFVPAQEAATTTTVAVVVNKGGVATTVAVAMKKGVRWVATRGRIAELAVRLLDPEVIAVQDRLQRLFDRLGSGLGSGKIDEAEAARVVAEGSCGTDGDDFAELREVDADLLVGRAGGDVTDVKRRRVRHNSNDGTFCGES
jgi:hypothetical protein